jgi:CheY-like chemotaxis protein
MPDGGTLAISTAVRTLADGTLRGVLTVADSGIGMAPEVIERAFEPFYSTKREPGAALAVRLQGGSGLGLAIVAGLVQDAGGTIEVESRVGHGSTFRVLLPVSTAPLAEPDAEPAVPPARRGGRILLVEDDVHVAAFVRTALTSAGHEVVAVANADDAWLMLGGGREEPDGTGDRPGRPPVDLVLTDIVMPGMGGAELARRLADATPRIPTILMSGYSDEVEALTAAARPAAFLDKPFTVAALLAAVGAALAATASDGGHAPPD